jgi:DNA polymerase IV
MSIVHVDINSYFATMLQQENPALRGKPVGVVKSLGRTCIIASSNEAKKVGIKTGCSVYEARKRSKDLVLVPTDFELFLSSTRRLKALFHSLSPDVNIFSLDEAFLNMTGCETFIRQLFPNHRSPSLHDFANLVQKRIKQDLGEWVQCNVGISHNHLLAKMASEIAPKGSVFEINETNVDHILSTVSFQDVCGVGYRLEKRLELLGVAHPYQINLLDDETLLEYFGPFWSKELRKIGKGEETHFFTRSPKVDHMQSVGRSFTVYKICDNEDEIKHTILNLTEEAALKLRKMNLSGRAVGISLHGRDTHWGRYLRLKYYVRHSDEIFNLLYHTLYEKWNRTFPIIKFGVYVGDLQPDTTISECWLPQWEKRQKIYTAIDNINNRFGLFTVKPATLLTNNIIKPEVTGFLGDKTYYGL